LQQLGEAVATGSGERRIGVDEHLVAFGAAQLVSQLAPESADGETLVGGAPACVQPAPIQHRHPHAVGQAGQAQPLQDALCLRLVIQRVGRTGNVVKGGHGMRLAAAEGGLQPQDGRTTPLTCQTPYHALQQF